MAEEAAQEAAMRAYEEALREAQQIGGGMAGGMLAQGFDPAMLESRHRIMFDDFAVGSVDDGERQKLQGYGQPHIDMLQELMGIPGTNLDDAATARQLLEVLEQQRQQHATLAAAQEALQRSSEKQDIMELPGEKFDEAAANHYLQALEHERQHRAPLTTADDAWQQRPQRHYLAISHDGELCFIHSSLRNCCSKVIFTYNPTFATRRDNIGSHSNSNRFRSARLVDDFCV